MLFFTCSWRFLRSNILEQLQFKLEKEILGFRNLAENTVRIFSKFISEKDAAIHTYYVLAVEVLKGMKIVRGHVSSAKISCIFFVGRV